MHPRGSRLWPTPSSPSTSIACCVAVAAVFATHSTVGATAPPSTPAPIFGDYELMTVGNLNMADSILEGPALVMGTATLDHFTVGGDGTNATAAVDGSDGAPSPCDAPLHALAVVGRATAKRGAIIGRAVLGAKSVLAPTVALPCAAAARPPPVDGRARSRHAPPPDPWEVFGSTGGVDISPLRSAAARATATLCRLPPTGTATVTGTTLHLYPRGTVGHGGMAGLPGAAGVVGGGPPGGNASCVDVFGVDRPADSLTRVVYYGVGAPLLLYRFRSVRWRGMDMGHLDAARSLHVVCGGGRLDVDASALRGSLLAPALHVAADAVEWAGRLAVEHLRGSAVRLRYGRWGGLPAAEVANNLC